MTDRKQAFDEVIEEYDESALKKAVDFKQHRFVSIERDKLTMERYVKGFKSMRGACDYLANSVMEGDPFVPEAVLDLDTGQKHELAVHAFVVPTSIDAVAAVLPRPAVALAVADNLAPQLTPALKAAL